MAFDIYVQEYNITEDVILYSDVWDKQKQFPMLIIGKDSYIRSGKIYYSGNNLDVYLMQVGRYSALAEDVRCIIDMNHDYKRVAQGRISGIDYQMPKGIVRKGQILIGHDCWIGQNVTIMGGVRIGNGAVVAAGSVVVKDIPPYAIAGGNPARIIGYRYTREQIQALEQIAWWNWSPECIRERADDLMSNDMDSFIMRYLQEAAEQSARRPSVDIKRIIPQEQGELYFYIPDFVESYPTYQHVIRAFIECYAGTKTELLLYVEEDDMLEGKLVLLDQIFQEYEQEEVYINLYIGHRDALESIMSQADHYVTSRCLENIDCVSAAERYGVHLISGVDIPVFDRTRLKGMVRELY